jgi:hypothetical protein
MNPYFNKTIRGLKQSISFVVAFLLCASIATAQQLSGSLTINNPTPQLADYANGSLNKLDLVITATNPEFSVQNVRLKLYIESGNTVMAIGNDVVVGATGNISLPYNAPQRFSSVSLAPYFQLQNLQGLNANTYQSTLPEGLYRFTFEVVDVTSQQVLGRISQQFWVTLNDPPLLNTPTNGENLPQNTNPTFTWVPRWSTASTQYIVTLVSLGNNFNNANLFQQFMALEATPYHRSQPRTNSQLSYDYATANGPMLIQGHTYAWRVQAIGGAFRNNGYSEIYTFKYYGNCAVVTGIAATPTGTDALQVTWNSSAVHSGYRVQYRKTGVANARWFEQSTTNNFVTLAQLEPNTEYEIKVGGVCMADMISYTPPVLARTAAVTIDPNCGQQTLINITNTSPLLILRINDTIRAAEIPICVSKITQPSGNGTYSGEGWGKLPWLGETKIKVKFSGVGINTDYRLTSGAIETVYDSSGFNTNMIDIDEAMANTLDLLSDLRNKLDELNALFSSGNQNAITQWINNNTGGLNSILSSIFANSRAVGATSSADSVAFMGKFNALLLAPSLINRNILLAAMTDLEYASAAKLSADIPNRIENFTNDNTIPHYWLTPMLTPMKFNADVNVAIKDYAYCSYGVEYLLPNGMLKGFTINGTDYVARIKSGLSARPRFLGYVKYDKYVNPNPDTDFYKEIVPTGDNIFPNNGKINYIEYVRNMTFKKLDRRIHYTVDVVGNKISKFIVIGNQIPENVESTLTFSNKTEKSVKTLNLQCDEGLGTLAYYIENDNLKKWLHGKGKTGTSIYFYKCEGAGSGKVLYKVTSNGTTNYTNSNVQKSSVENDFSNTGDRHYNLFVCIGDDGTWKDIDIKFKPNSMTPNERFTNPRQGQRPMTEEEGKKAINDAINDLKNKSNANKSGNSKGNEVPEETAKDATGRDMGKISSEGGTLVEIITEVVEAGQSIIKDAQMPPKYWDKTLPGYEKSMLHLPPTLGGVGDGVMDRVTETVQFVNMGLSIVKDPGQIKKGWEQLKGLKFSQVKDGIIASVTTQVQEVANGTDKGWHIIGKTGTQLAMGGFLGRLKGLNTSKIADVGGDVSKKFAKSGIIGRLANRVNAKAWVDRLDEAADADLLKKIDGLDDIKLDKLDDFYSSNRFQKPATEYIVSTNPDGSFRARVRNGIEEIDYDKNGFPDFRSFSAGQDYAIKSNDIRGKIEGHPFNTPHPDNVMANNNLINKYGANNIDIRHVSGSPILLKINERWVGPFTWHHHQDGLTMMPVMSNVHNFTAHTGGQSVIPSDLKGLFGSPY